jgi:hypothetical protein
MGNPAARVSAPLSSLQLPPAIAPGGFLGKERMMEWQLIETAPEAERVLVAGYDARLEYWWWHEDTVFRRKASEYEDATHWCPIVLPPFPSPSGDA